jgi:hypothetical protein
MVTWFGWLIARPLVCCGKITYKAIGGPKVHKNPFYKEVDMSSDNLYISHVLREVIP